MNLVGYKVDGEVQAQGRPRAFYMNLVGYKVVTNFPKYRTPNGFI